MTTTIVSLRKFSRIAPTILAEVLITHGERVIGTFTPTADDIPITAPVPAASPGFSPAPKPGKKP